ncbi:PKD-like family lipoprotein [Pedobacter sp. UBA5917]|jgi:hypothetical protein|uniref:PKD-like family lipoprotein n=1 Tax=Pedobacter sp. UBA5917 TaxID=1947061 RepID=UPI0025E70E22|nr:PKD-like family lipoprotein [Pedobacter sp. UBA5917]
MKNYIIKTIGFCLVMLFALGCSKDLGNYDYHEINEGSISNILPTYTSLRGVTLSIDPTLTFTQDNTNDTTKYSYKWSYIDYTVLPLTKKTIATSKNLNWTVSIAASNTAYEVWYEVTEKSTGLVARKSTKLTVTTNIADGWLVLNDIDGKARLDFFNYVNNDFQYFNDVLASNSTLVLTGKPKMVYFCQRRDPFTSIIAKSIFVGTDQGTSIINTQANNFSTFSNFTNSMTNYVPAPYYAEKVKAQASSYLLYLLDSKGQLFYENPTVGYAFGTRVNRLSTGQDINISPYFAEAYKNISTYALMYDVDNKRFVEHKNYATASSVPATTSALFNPGDMKMDLMYMDYTPAISGQAFAILKDAANKIFLARIVCNASTFSPQAFDEVLVPEMVNATQFAIDPSEGYIMYLVGSKVYRYNPFDKTNAMVLDLGSRKVSLMKYQRLVFSTATARYVEYSKKLIICTYDAASPSTSGTMDLYNVPNLNGALSPYKSFTGLGKIVDVTYRE